MKLGLQASRPVHHPREGTEVSKLQSDRVTAPKLMDGQQDHILTPEHVSSVPGTQGLPTPSPCLPLQPPPPQSLSSNPHLDHTKPLAGQEDTAEASLLLLVSLLGHVAPFTCHILLSSDDCSKMITIKHETRKTMPFFPE